MLLSAQDSTPEVACLGHCLQHIVLLEPCGFLLCVIIMHEILVFVLRLFDDIFPIYH